MSERDPWKSRVLIGSGVLTAVALVALPALVTTPEGPEPSPPGERPVRASARWFGLAATPAVSRDERECFELPALGGRLVPAAELSVVHLSDGTVRLTGLLAERAKPDNLWLLDTEFADRIKPGDRLDRVMEAMAEELAFELGHSPGGAIDFDGWRYYGKLEGSLRGLGDRLGALVRVSSTGGAAAQIGSWANGKNSGLGARAHFYLEVIEQPTTGPPLPRAPSRGELRLDLADQNVCSALRPVSPRAASEAPPCALTLAGLGGFQFVAGGQFVEQGSGRAKLTGVLARTDDPSSRLAVDLTFEDIVSPGESDYPPSGGDLEPALDAQNDSSSWHYYRSLRGTLTGFGPLQGVRLEASLLGPAVQIGLGASGESRQYGASAWIVADVVSRPNEEIRLPDRIESGELRFAIRSGSGQCVDAAKATALFRHERRGAIQLPGFGRDFVFTAGGYLSEQPDGTARLTGVIQRREAPAHRFQIDLEFAGRLNAGVGNFPPGDSPWRDLLGPAYRERGGPVDAAAWHYYPSVRGLLTGQGALDGARLVIERDGPAWQVGVGAGGRSLAYGLSGWFSGVLRRQPHDGEILPPTLSSGHFHLDLGATRVQSVCEARRASAKQEVRGDSALDLDELGSDFVFLSGGQLHQLADGTARLNGVVARASFPLQRFFLDLRLDHRIDPGAAGYPPPGSPKRALVGAAYTAGGGPVDTDSWAYYRSLKGHLIGLESFAGGVLAISGTGPAFQLGAGANNVNTAHGAAAWLAVTILEQPDGEVSFPSGLERGRLQLDLQRSRPDCAKEALAIPAVELPAGYAFSLPGIATDLVFSDEGVFQEFGDGTARLTGELERAGDGSGGGFEVLIELDGRLEGAGSQPLPPGSPRFELPRTAHAGSGGPVSPERWHYYRELEGILVGLGDFAGALLEIEEDGAFQVGLGANGRNLDHGASGVLDVRLIQQPTAGPALPGESVGARINLDLFAAPPRE